MAIVERLFWELGRTEVAVATVQWCLLERGQREVDLFYQRPPGQG